MGFKNQSPEVNYFLNGLFLVNKPKGLLSYELVKELRKLTGIRSVGHAGTLDPLASGLMILLLGKGTKFSDEFRNSDKTYEVKIRLGLTSSTLDKDGEILSRKEVSLNPREVKAQAQALMGELELRVPFFSAVKVQGQKLYQFARRGERVDLPLKRMRFYDLVVMDQGRDFLKCRFSCSKGSYVRAWSHFLGEKLKVGAIVEELHRTRSAPYSVDRAMEWEDFKKGLLVEKRSSFFLGEDFRKSFVPVEDFFSHWKTVGVTGQDKKLMEDGQISHRLNRRLIVERKKADFSGESVGIKVLNHQDGNLLALLKAEPKQGLRVKNCFRD